VEIGGITVVWIEIDTEVIKKMALERWVIKGRGLSETCEVWGQKDIRALMCFKV
jgi:hypothetical protein